MIPDETIQKALEAYDANVGFPAVSPLALKAALEAAAADIWDEGYDAGSDDTNAHERGVTPEEFNQYTANPYCKGGE